METYKFTLPPKIPGVYAFRHVPTQRIYIGSTSNLFRRFQEWRPAIMAGNYWKSGILQEALTGTKPEEWEFIVVASFETGNEAVEMEKNLITGLKGMNPNLLLNTREPGKEKIIGVGNVAQSVVTHEGRAVSYREAAEVLGVRIETISKRLAKYRARGVTEVTTDFLRSKGTGRPKNSV